MATPRAAAPTSPPQGQEALRSTHGTEFTPTEQGRSAGGGSGGSDNRVNDLLIAFRDMQREMVDGQTRLVEHLTTQPSSGTGGSGEERVNDKLNALTGIEFKQTLPVIRDADPDFDNVGRSHRLGVSTSTGGMFSPSWTAMPSVGKGFAR